MSSCRDTAISQSASRGTELKDAMGQLGSRTI
jgi:hypothetical protein